MGVATPVHDQEKKLSKKVGDAKTSSRFDSPNMHVEAHPSA